MSFWWRILIMVVVSEFTLTIILGGLEPQSMIMAGSLVLFFSTLPLIAVVVLLDRIQNALGRIGTVLTIMVGFIPTIFVFVIGPAMGIKGGNSEYTAILSVAGLPWSGAWYLTSPKSFSVR